MTYKCKIFDAFNLTWVLYTGMCTVSKVIGINIENKICLPNKQYINI